MTGQEPSGAAGARRPLRAVAGSGLAIAAVLWLLWVVNFNDLEFGGTDALRPFSLVQAIFGERDDPAGYQFGLAYLWTPFYAVGKLVSVAGVETAEGEPIGIAAIALGTSLLVFAIGAAILPVLRGLRLGHEAFALGAGVFGSPLFFYGSFSTGLSHVADTLLVTLLALLAYRYFQDERPSLWLPAAMGAIGGYAVSVRFFNGFVVLALALGLLLYRRVAAAVILSAAATATFVVLAGIAFALGVTSLTSGYVSGADASEVVSSAFAFSPETLVRMLVSDHGFLVWTPVTLLGIAGYVLLSRRRSEARPFLVTLGLMGLGLVLPYAFVTFLTPSFSQRYWTPLFPIVVLGLAALAEARPRVVVPAAWAAVAWTLALTFYTAPGLGYVDGASHFPRRVLSGEIAPSHYVHSIYHRSRLLSLLPDPWDHGPASSETAGTLGAVPG